MTLFLNFDAATMCILMACQGETEFKTKPHVRLTCLALLSLSLLLSGNFANDTLCIAAAD